MTLDCPQPRVHYFDGFQCVSQVGVALSLFSREGQVTLTSAGVFRAHETIARVGWVLRVPTVNGNLARESFVIIGMKRPIRSSLYL